MAGIKGLNELLVLLAFLGSVGMTLVVLGCALPSFGSDIPVPMHSLCVCPLCSRWWPFFVVIFYVLAPLPSIIARRYQDDVGSSNACKELALFLTAGIVISAYGLPIILARSPLGPEQIIQTGASFDNDDDGYNMW
ncbi:unnamed protein product [Oppiella nova]|uniref:Uncharacterized protein n=1 Tax=Oppiella nova TaxID=334625 RepID=A0A7R9MJD0_9ACAR|nr:unnamed protein product [Oppiella nova]CAG2178207.1 unnamed protein product [Oppiella nova]